MSPSPQVSLEVSRIDLEVRRGSFRANAKIWIFSKTGIMEVSVFLTQKNLILRGLRLLYKIMFEYLHLR